MNLKTLMTSLAAATVFATPLIAEEPINPSINQEQLDIIEHAESLGLVWRQLLHKELFDEDCYYFEGQDPSVISMHKTGRHDSRYCFAEPLLPVLTS